MKEAHPDKEVQVWFQDEARFGQQGTTTRIWARKGSRPSAVKQCKYKWLYLYDAVCPATGNSAAMIAPCVNIQYPTIPTAPRATTEMPMAAMRSVVNRAFCR